MAIIIIPNMTLDLIQITVITRIVVSLQMKLSHRQRDNPVLGSLGIPVVPSTFQYLKVVVGLSQ